MVAVLLVVGLAVPGVAAGPGRHRPRPPAGVVGPSRTRTTPPGRAQPATPAPTGAVSGSAAPEPATSGSAPGAEAGPPATGAASRYVPVALAPRPAEIVAAGHGGGPRCGAPANPWGYNLCGRGDPVGAPPAGLCGYLDCVTPFPDAAGYLVRCRDHQYSLGGGLPAGCAGHRGRLETVYSGP